MTLIAPAQTVGKRLKAARALAGLEQQQVADALSIPRSSLSAWENGHNEPLASSFLRLAQVLDVSLDWLAWGVGPIEAPVVRPEGFEPPTFWLGVSDLLANFESSDEQLRCFVCGGPHDLDDCPRADELDDAIAALLEAATA